MVISRRIPTEFDGFLFEVIMGEKTCCFTGHREIEKKNYVRIKESTKNAIVALIKRGVIYYGAGGARGYDTIAAETVLELKKSIRRLN